jgi:hypothetical protein
MTDDATPAAALLASDDWRPLELYPAGEFAYVRGRYAGALTPDVVVARHNGKPWSNWMHPPPGGVVTYFSATAWQPLPADTNAYEAAYFLHGAPEPIMRPPEPVYAPGGIDARLTPVPAKLLRTIAAGAVLQERAQTWTEWKLRHPCGEIEKITERGVNKLRQVAFIERVGVRPLQRPDRWIQFDWRITDAGEAWLTANQEQHPSVTAQQKSSVNERMEDPSGENKNLIAR